MTLVLLDLLLAAGMTMRLTRLVTTDHLGRWWIGEPIEKQNENSNRPIWGYLEALTSCGFCIGFHIGWIVLVSLWGAGGPGDTAEWWRWVAGTFTLNYVAAHIGSRLDVSDE